MWHRVPAVASVALVFAVLGPLLVGMAACARIPWGASLATAAPTAQVLLEATPSEAAGDRGAVPDATHTPTPSSPHVVRYESPTLGFTLEYPSSWSAPEWHSGTDASFRAWESQSLLTNVYTGGSQAFGRYTVHVAAAPAAADTLTETLERETAIIAPTVREAIVQECCTTLAGEPALTVQYGWPMSRWGRRTVIALHEGTEFRVSIEPDPYRFATGDDLAMRDDFEAVLDSIAFVPITATRTPTAPPPTPAPTPTVRG